MSKLLRLDPIACDGHGLCAELFPERIQLDDWGFPLVDGRPIPPGLEEHARRAVAECPKVALRLVAARKTALARSASRHEKGIRGSFGDERKRQT